LGRPIWTADGVDNLIYSFFGNIKGKLFKWVKDCRVLSKTGPE